MNNVKLFIEGLVRANNITQECSQRVIQELTNVFNSEYYKYKSLFMVEDGVIIGFSPSFESEESAIIEMAVEIGLPNHVIEDHKKEVAYDDWLLSLKSDLANMLGGIFIYKYIQAVSVEYARHNNKA